jgi:hypothetical protein
MSGGRLNRTAGAPRGWPRGGADYIEMGDTRADDGHGRHLTICRRIDCDIRSVALWTALPNRLHFDKLQLLAARWNASSHADPVPI